VTTEERVIAQLAESNPMPDSASPTAQERAEAERILRRVLDDAPRPPRHTRRRPPLGILAPVVSVLVVIVVAAVLLRTGSSPTATGVSPSGGLNISLTALPTPQTPRVTATAMSREIAVLRRRLRSVWHGFTVSQSGAAGIVVTLPKAAVAQRRRIEDLITQPGQLRFYDWEATVLTPNGRTVASQLLAQDHAALLASEGANHGPGPPGAGGMPLYDAVALAAKQPLRLGRTGARLGPEYYLFGAPGSPACAAAERQWGVARPIPGLHCLLAGPLDLGASVSRRQAIDALAAQVPTGVNASQGQVRAVPQGTAVIQAEQLRAADPVPIISPTAEFFVMRDDVALAAADITHPKAGLDQSGQPDVTFGFTRAGRAAFERVTKAIAHRGANVSVAGTTVNQHFAVALDNQLLTVPQIDFRPYPDGIIGAGGADITGGFTRQSARDLATELRYGALPLAVRVVR
jgi:SecD/SecF fusion protein